MHTDNLIAALSADARPARPLPAVVLIALALAVPFSVALFGIMLGLRPDIEAVLGNLFFLLKFAVTMTLAVAAGVIGLSLARPAMPVRQRLWLLAIPAVFLTAGIAADLYLPQSRGWSQRMVGNNAMVCCLMVPLLSLPFLAAAMIALRNGASLRPAVTGAVAGMLAGSLGAFLYAAHCGDDSPLFVMVWYSLGIGVVAIAGALIGRRALRF